MEYTNIKFKDGNEIQNIDEIYMAVQKNHSLYETNAKKLLNNSIDELEKVGFWMFNDKTAKLESHIQVKRFMKVHAVNDNGTAIVFLTGRAVVNNDYLISIISAGMIRGIKNLIICAFDKYKGARDYSKIIEFTRSLATSNLEFGINNVLIMELKHVD